MDMRMASDYFTNGINYFYTEEILLAHATPGSFGTLPFRHGAFVHDGCDSPRGLKILGNLYPFVEPNSFPPGPSQTWIKILMQRPIIFFIYLIYLFSSTSCLLVLVIQPREQHPPTASLQTWSASAMVLLKNCDISLRRTVSLKTMYYYIQTDCCVQYHLRRLQIR